MIKTTIYSTRWKNQKEKQDKEGEEDMYSAALLIAETSLFPSFPACCRGSDPFKSMEVAKLSLITIHK